MLDTSRESTVPALLGAKALSLAGRQVKEHIREGDAAGHYQKAGALLIQIKESLPKGRFQAFLHQFEINERTAQFCMQICRDPPALERQKARNRAKEAATRAAARKALHAAPMSEAAYQAAGAAYQAHKNEVRARTPTETPSNPVARADTSAGAISEAARGFKASIQRMRKASDVDHKEWKRWRNTAFGHFKLLLECSNLPQIAEMPAAEIIKLLEVI